MDEMTLILMDPVSGFILAEQIEEKRDAQTWHKVTQAALKGLNVTIQQLVGDEAGGLTKLAEDNLNVIKGPDLFHVQQEITKGLTSHLGRTLQQVKKKQEDLHLVTVKLDDIIYEFWNGKFSGVIIKVRGDNQFKILKDYVFARFGPGQRSKVLEQLNVQNFYYNGVKTRMYLKFSDIDRTGELSLYSIALLSKQQNIDTLYLRERAKEKIDAWEKTKAK